MPSYKINKLFLFFFSWFNIALAQNFPSKNYTAASELPNNTVRSLLVDSQNTLWVGTDNGVVKKENDVFKYFFEEDGLALNSCWAIAEDENKHIWLGSYGGGVSIYDGYKFKIISEKDGLVHNEVTKLFSYDNSMYVGTSNGVSKINIHNFEVDSWSIPTEDKLNRVEGFFEYNSQVYVVTYETGIYKFSAEKGQTNLVKVNDHRYIYAVFKNKDSIYSSNKGYFINTDLETYLKEEQSLPKNILGRSIIWDYAETSDHRLFAAAWGIYDSSGGIYELTNNRLISRASDFNIPSVEVISLAHDAMFNKLYVGTRDAGLYEIKLDPQIKFHKISGKNVLGFAQTENTSALLLSDGINLKSKEQEKNIGLDQLKSWQKNYIATTRIPLPKIEDEFYELEYTIKSEDIHIYDIKAFQEKYWINTNIGIFAIDESGELHRYLPLHSEEINFTPEGRLVETHPYGGIRVYSDLDKFEYSHFLKDDPDTPTMVVNSLKQNNKTYFTSIFSGLYVSKNQKFESYLRKGIWKEEKLRHIASLGNDLAISSEFGDVYIINDGSEFQILKKISRASIPGNSISFLKEFNGSLLIGTEKGLTIYKDERYIFLNEEQGLKQPLLSTAVIENNLVVGSENGYFNINLNAVIDPQPLINQIKLEEIFINNNEYASEEIFNREQISLSYDQNTVLLKFSTNAHPYPHKLKYQYRINETENWSNTTSSPEIFLPFLPAENYHVDVKILDGSTGLSYIQKLINLKIQPPFWKTWWFAALVLVSVLIIVYGIYSYQIKQNQEFEAQKGLIQKRFEETKMEALLAQMNPHFIFNAMNSIQYYIMENDIDNATVFLGDFSKLIRLNLDHCTKPKILLIEEIEYLQSYIRVENTRFNNKINVSTDIDPEIDPYEIEIPTMLLQTFIENVFVHAFPPEVSNPTLKISFELFSEKLLHCKIEDNGIGYSTSASNKLHQSKGVNLVKERLALLGYDVEKALQIKSTEKEGVCVVLRLQIER